MERRDCLGRQEALERRVLPGQSVYLLMVWDRLVSQGQQGLQARQGLLDLQVGLVALAPLAEQDLPGKLELRASAASREPQVPMDLAVKREESVKLVSNFTV